MTLLSFQGISKSFKSTNTSFYKDAFTKSSSPKKPLKIISFQLFDVWSVVRKTNIYYDVIELYSDFNMRCL